MCSTAMKTRKSKVPTEMFGSGRISRAIRKRPTRVWEIRVRADVEDYLEGGQRPTVDGKSENYEEVSCLTGQTTLPVYTPVYWIIYSISTENVYLTDDVNN